MPDDLVPLVPALIAVLFGLSCVLSPLGQHDRDQRTLTVIGVCLISAAVFGVLLPLWAHRAV